MSSISRRAVLSAGGTAAAGTILVNAGPARAAEPRARAADTTTASVPAGTQCRGYTAVTFPDGDDGSELTITFTIEQSDNTPSDHLITEHDLANAISAFAQTLGWPAVTFYGAPAPVAVN